MNWRIVTTLSLFLLAIAVIISGITLYIGPPGSLKQATLLGLTKDQWSGLHTVSALAMAGIVLFHVWFNRRALVMYFKRVKASEGAIVLLIALLFIITPLLNAPPGSWILQVSEEIAASWVSHYSGAKGFGFMTLSEFCQQYGVPLQKAMSYLKGMGLNPSPNSYLRDLAEELGTSPAALAEKLLALRSQLSRATTTLIPSTNAQQSVPQTSQPQAPRQGMGLMTLRDFCQQNGISLEKAIQYIEQKYGVKVSPDMTIRDIAFSAGLKPYQIIQELMALR